MSNVLPDLHLRPETPADDGFLAYLFASTRAAEVASLAGGAAVRETFLRIQSMAQRAGHKAQHPGAERSIVLVDGAPVGRWMVDRSGHTLVLVDVALLPEQRGRGLGAALIRALLAEAARQRRPVGLHVLRSSPAARLYERLGFVRTGGSEIHDAMEWRPPGSH